MPKFNLGWLKDKNGEKFAPKTFLSQILQNDGSLFQDRIVNIENTLKDHDDKIMNNDVISNHEERISQNTNDISSLTTKVNQNTNDISSLSNQITQYNEAITDHEERITNHEKQYSQTYFVLTDDVTNCDYVVKMHNGNIIYFKKCTGIKLVSPPINLNVIEGGLLDTTGMIIVGCYQDGTESEIINYKLEPEENGSVKVTYEEAGETYIMSINVNVISIEEALKDFTYTTNSNGTYTLTGWKGTLNGETSTRLVVPNSVKVLI